eukprot:6213284-Pleurochrysis_carterae.AAC.2
MGAAFPFLSPPPLIGARPLPSLRARPFPLMIGARPFASFRARPFPSLPFDRGAAIPRPQGAALPPSQGAALSLIGARPFPLSKASLSCSA